MKKLMRHIATTGVCAAVAGVAVLTTGSSAMAASPRTPGPLPVRTTAVATEHSCSRRAAHRGMDPWVAGQLEMFEPAAAKRLAVYDPWVKDQLALFAPASR